MFTKVLVANRGEIAVRIMRTLREMGIKTVAVYSEADTTARHVREADEAYLLGPAPSAESYLLIEKVIEACHLSGAEAVHPGYGFLSENPKFARACSAAGITFIGPEPEAMEAMGSKTAARTRMIAANVPVVPGAEAANIDELKAAAETVGYPVMLKASAGGGGKGMRLVHEPDGLESAWERARSEALKSFGDDTVYLEKAILNPRHVEIQVLADRDGNTVHLFERDCSIQRRHQKVVEETPSPAASPELVEEMGAVAVRAAEAVGYHSAGTIEFLVGADSSFYFLEMNTRLQVEHPVTEMICGLDLVREQVRIAAGEPLGLSQADVVRRGHAIECRIYAEDPSTGFLPSPGTINTLRTPHGPGIRDDSGVYEGAEITSFYDPLVSKLCAWAPTREAAVAKIARALSEYVVIGPRTNLPFHLRLMKHPDFVAGNYDTGFIARHEAALLQDEPLSEEESRLFAAALAAERALREAQVSSPPSSGRSATALSPWRLASLTNKT
jgi:acetyl-CoA carboxylase biotin carboxylase subunit